MHLFEDAAVTSRRLSAFFICELGLMAAQCRSVYEPIPARGISGLYNKGMTRFNTLKMGCYQLHNLPI